MPILRTLAAAAPLALLAAAADAPETRAGQYRNVTVIGAERYVVSECRAATPIDAASAEGGCTATRSRVAGGVIDVALACPGGRSKTLTGRYTLDGFTLRTVARGYGPALVVSQVTSTRVGDCTPEE